MILGREEIRGHTPEIKVEVPDYSHCDYNRSEMYVQLLQKKNLKHYRDPDGVVHMGTTNNQDQIDHYKSDSSLENNT